jgi:hypothetical protein
VMLSIPLVRNVFVDHIRIYNNYADPVPSGLKIFGSNKSPG